MTEEKAKNTEFQSAEDILAGFIRSNRKAILTAVILIAAGITGFITVYGIREALEKKAIAAVEEYSRRFSEITETEMSSSSADALLEELSGFASSTFGYAAAKAWSLAAEMYASRKNWAAAEEAWLAAAKRAPRIFLAPFSLYNAAAAAEEQGNLENALEYHGRCVEYQGLNPAAVRSQFSIGRIRERQDNREAALEAYRKVVQNWPSDVNWTNLAQSRIIFLGN